MMYKITVKIFGITVLTIEIVRPGGLKFDEGIFEELD